MYRNRNRFISLVAVAVLLALASCARLPTPVSPLPTPESVIGRIDTDTITFSMRLYWEDSVTGAPGYDHRIVTEVPVASLWAVGRVRDAAGEILTEWEWDTGIGPYVVSDGSGPGSGPYGDPILFVVTPADYPAGVTLTVSGMLFWRVEGEGDIPCVPDSADVVGPDGFSVLGDFVGSGVEMYQVFMPLVMRGED